MEPIWLCRWEDEFIPAEHADGISIFVTLPYHRADVATEAEKPQLHCKIVLGWRPEKYANDVQ